MYSMTLYLNLLVGCFFVVQFAYFYPCDGLTLEKICNKTIEQSVLKSTCVKTRKSKCVKTEKKRVKQLKVVCCDGYYLENKLCQPQCLMGCDGGRCVEPEKCQCDIPLVLNNETNACILPTCDPPCINSICQNTNECHCITGYDPVNTTHCAPKCSTGYKINPNTLNCVPTCNLDCVNGTCSAPNICTCDAGYKLKSDDVYNICSPVCDSTCTNADCTEPNVCTCHEGYTKIIDNSTSCEPECEDCDHGECVLPNQCLCHDGYENIDGVCEPNCGSGCKNGYCSAPSHCICDPGFKHSNIDNLTCIPNCDPDCINSTCKAPNLCVCNEGYERVDSRSCKPKCNNCLNGTCSSPDVCSCDEGYIYENGLCKPVCNETCDNGFCSSPNTCTCYDGFINGLNGCFKPCKSDCIGGTCNVLGECICDDEYMFINNTCQPIPMIDCDVCVMDRKCIENKCLCNDGRACQVVNVELPESEARSSTVLAVLELTGAVCLVLIIVLLVVIVTIWRKRKHAQAKVVDDGHQYGSIMYTSTAPNTLVKHNEKFLNEEMVDEVFENNINDNVEIDNYERNCKIYKKDGDEAIESVHPLLTTNNTEL